MGAGGRGLTALFGVVLAVALAVGESGGGSALIFQLTHYRATSLLRPAAITLAVASILVPLIFWMLGKFPGAYFIAVMLASVILLFYTLGLHLLLAAKRLAWFSILQALPALVLLAVLFLLRRPATLSPGLYLWGYVVAYGSGLILVVASLWRTDLLKKTCTLPAATTVSAFKPSMLNQGGHLASLAQNRLVFLVFPAVAIGVYANALALGEALLLGAGSVGQVLYSKFAGRGGSARTWWRWLALAVVITGGGGLVLAMLPATFYAWLFGPEFGGIKIYLPFILPAITAYAVYLVISYYFSSRGWFALNIWCMFVGLFTQGVVLGVCWANRQFDLRSAALAYLMGCVLLALVSLLVFVKRSKAE